jgi:DNA-binding transcriptional MerR regulator
MLGAGRREEPKGIASRMEGFTAHQACKFTGCSARQLRYWDQIGLVEPSVQSTGGRPGVPRLYSFRDLVALRVVKSLIDGGMSLQRVRRSWEFLNKKAGLDRHLSEVKLVTDGQSIFKICRRDGEVIDALKDGQMAFFVAIDDIATSVHSNVRSFEEDRERFVRGLREAAAQTATGT